MEDPYPGLGLAVDRRTHEAMHRQIKSQLANQIRSGAMAGGTRMPTIRALAAELGVNRNTVQKVYASLGRAGLISTKVGSGTFVVHRQVEPVSPLLKETRASLGAALNAALEGGLSVLDLRQIFENELSEARRLREAKAADVLNSRSRFARWQVKRI